MTDRLDRADIRLQLARQRLYRRAREDLEGSVISAADYEAPISSSGGTSSTETAGLARAQDLVWAGEHQTITRALEQAASLLERTEERITPTVTGLDCTTATRDPETGKMVSCTGQAIYGRRCADCHHDWRPRQGIAIPVDVIDARNNRRPRMCDCGPECCQTDQGGHTTCQDRAATGRTVSERCRKRMQRANA